MLDQIVLNRRLPAREHLYALGGDIAADDRVVLREHDRIGKADITKPENGYLHRMSRQESTVASIGNAPPSVKMRWRMQPLPDGFYQTK
ncbi:hypothetical protein [Qipengyuania flava]|uniref:hypothetical protein n=1 Tax=Qipengyuania flava TaxID=192812 RepID=UPI001E436676|nr:hypothetical protein [Qipengyuania flava]